MKKFCIIEGHNARSVCELLENFSKKHTILDIDYSICKDRNYFRSCLITYIDNDENKTELATEQKIKKTAEDVDDDFNIMLFANDNKE